MPTPPSVLQQQFDSAIRSENYEEASRLFDEVFRLLVTTGRNLQYVRDESQQRAIAAGEQAALSRTDYADLETKYNAEKKRAEKAEQHIETALHARDQTIDQWKKESSDLKERLKSAEARLSVTQRDLKAAEELLDEADNLWVQRDERQTLSLETLALAAITYLERDKQRNQPITVNGPLVALEEFIPAVQYISNQPGCCGGGCCHE